MQPQYHVVIFGTGKKTDNPPSTLNCEHDCTLVIGTTDCNEYHRFNRQTELVKWLKNCEVIGCDPSDEQDQFAQMPDGRQLLVFRGIRKTIEEKVVKKTQLGLI